MSNFMWGFQTQVVLLYFFSLLAFCFTGKAIETKQGGRYFGACACAVCASLCQAAGLLVFPAIILLAAWHWRRAGRAGLLAIAGVTVLMAAFYVWGPGGRLQSSAALVSMPGQGLFALSFLGSPLAAIAPQLVIPAGVIATGLSVLLIVRYTKIATPRLDETVAVAICLFVPTIAAAAAVSRISLGMADATESRFVTPALFLWCGLLVGFWPFLTHRSAALCALAVAAYSLLSHLWLPYDYLPLRDLKANGEIAYVAGVKDANRLSVLGNLDRIWAVRPFLLRHGLAPFSTAVSQAVGRRLSDVYQPMPALCLGQLDGVLEPVEGNEGYRLYGWALADNGRAPEAVLLVQHDVVVGMGRFVQDRSDVMASVDRAKELKVGFIGAVRDLSDPVKAYVVNRGRACPLGGEVSDRSMSSMRSK